MKVVIKQRRKYTEIEINTDFKREMAYLGLKQLSNYLAGYYYLHPEIAKSSIAQRVAAIARDYCYFYVLKKDSEEVISAINEILEQKNNLAPWMSDLQIPEGESTPTGMYTYAGFLIHIKGMSWGDYCKHIAQRS